MEVQRYARWRGGKGKEQWEENILSNSNSILSRPSWRAWQTVFPSNLILHRLLYDPRFSSTSWLRKFSRPWSVFLNYQRKIKFCSAWCNTITYTLLYIYSMEIPKFCQAIETHSKLFDGSRHSIATVPKLSLCKITRASNSIFQLKEKHHIVNQEFLLHKQVVKFWRKKAPRPKQALPSWFPIRVRPWVHLEKPGQGFGYPNPSRSHRHLLCTL